MGSNLVGQQLCNIQLHIGGTLVICSPEFASALGCTCTVFLLPPKNGRSPETTQVLKVSAARCHDQDFIISGRDTVIIMNVSNAVSGRTS